MKANSEYVNYRSQSYWISMNNNYLSFTYFWMFVKLPPSTLMAINWVRLVAINADTLFNAFDLILISFRKINRVKSSEVIGTLTSLPTPFSNVILVVIKLIILSCFIVLILTGWFNEGQFRICKSSISKLLN